MLNIKKKKKQIFKLKHNYKHYIILHFNLIYLFSNVKSQLFID